MKKNNKRKDKNSYIKNTDKMAGLGKFVEQYSVPVFADYAMGTLDEENGIFYDKLDGKKEYKVFTSLESAQKAFKDGILKLDERYCYSTYDAKTLFPKILEFHTQKEVEDYLCLYNEKGNNCLNWTFMDAEEREKLRKKQNRTKII